jgi:hypothetical protein
MCVLTPDPGDITGAAFLVNPAGPVTMQTNSLTGSVIFRQDKTTVTDSMGNPVTCTFPTPDTCSFPTKTGQIYALHTAYLCLPPNSTGKLNEACPGGVEMGDIFPDTGAQDFTIKA